MIVFTLKNFELIMSLVSSKSFEDEKKDFQKMNSI